MSGAQGYWINLLAWVLLHFAWQGLFLAISWRACDMMMRAVAPQIRYRAAWLHLTALAVAPLLTLLVSHHALVASVSAGSSAGSRGWVQNLSRPPLPVWPLFHLLGRALPGLLTLWVVGVLVGVVFLLAGCARHSRLMPVPPDREELLSVIDELAGKLELRSPPLVFEAEVASPFVRGVCRQRLVLPCEIERQLPSAELKAILAHELAHFKRSDYGSNLLQSILVVLLWPHPAAWYLWARTRQEREACCDELAVQTCGSAAPLARGLYRLAARAPAFSASALAAATGPLERRLQRLLQPRQPSTPLASRAAALPALGALALATLLSARMLPTDRPTQRALIASRWSPTMTVHAHDPAGSFQVKMRRGRVLAISFGDEQVPSKQVIQQGDVVRVLASSGQELLSLTLDPRGGFRWEPRPAGAQPSL